MSNSSNQYYLSLGAGKNQVPLILAAKKAGYLVIGVDMRIDAEGFEFCDLRIQESILNYRKVQRKIELLMLDGKIVGGFSASYGNALASWAFLVERFSLFGLNRTLIESLLDKGLVRQKLMNVVDTQYFLQPKYILPQKRVTRSELDELGFPLIIKSRHGFSKKNIYLAENYQQSKDYLLNGKSDESKIAMNDLLIEEFIDGDEITVCGIVQEFKFSLLTITDKVTAQQAPFVELEHVYPSQYASLGDIIEQMHQKIVEALQISFAPIVSEWKIKHNRLYLIEISPQIPGEYLSHFVIPQALNYDYFKNIVYLTTGKTIDKIPQNKSSKKITVRYFCEKVEDSRWQEWSKDAAFAEILNPNPHSPPLSNLDRYGVIGYIQS